MMDMPYDVFSSPKTQTAMRFSWLRLEKPADTGFRSPTLRDTYLIASAEVEHDVVTESKVLHGVPRIAGTRIPVWVILRDLAEGFTLEQISKDYPPLTVAQVKKAVEFAAIVMETSADEYKLLPIESDFTPGYPLRGDTSDEVARWHISGSFVTSTYLPQP